jgi:hypothetical protein
MKMFTVFLDYSAGSAISQVQLPPGLMADPSLIGGGTFTADVSGNLTFLGLSSLTLQNTSFPFLVGMQISGYIASGAWIPMPATYISPTQTHYEITADYSVQFVNMVLGNINGGNTANRPGAGVTAGYLVALTLFYM